ncbi:hypothetical protein ACFE04_024059 [Oxalis oulophora]
MSQALSTLNLAPCSFPGSFSSSNSSRNLLKANGVVDLRRRRRRYKNSINVKANADDDQTTRDNLDHLQRQTITTTTKPNKRVAAVAPIALWDRFPTARTVQQMMDTMERIMDDPFAYSARIPSPTDTTNNTSYNNRGRAPWDIKQGEKEYKLRFDMPGMTKDDVKVWVQDKMLFIKAEKTVEAENEQGEQKEEAEAEAEAEQVWSAKSYGKYSSRIALPENIEFEKIEAEVKDGVLYISIPKADSTSAKILDINVA